MDFRYGPFGYCQSRTTSQMSGKRHGGATSREHEEFCLTTGHFLLRLSDLALLCIHGALLIFNATGWAWKRTRRLHLATISATVASWFGLGALYGWGYCPLTDWHWRVKRALGETGLPASWVKYYLDRVAGVAWDPVVVDAVVGATGAAALALAASLALRDRLAGRAAGPRDTQGLRPRAGCGKVQGRQAAGAATTSATEDE